MQIIFKKTITCKIFKFSKNFMFFMNFFYTEAPKILWPAGNIAWFFRVVVGQMDFLLEVF
jgi:hypothetical protein